jgi:FAD dependent oxidoreductase
MSNAAPVVVIGAGVAGCAAAVAAAEAGAPTILLEATRMVGGVAVQGEHRTLCGLAPIDAAAPELLEPTLTSAWLPLVSTGPGYRQGRVWLWPTTAATLQRGLLQRVVAARVDLRLDARVLGAEESAAGIRLHLRDGSLIDAAAVIDASGAALVAGLLELPCAAPVQWPAHRSLLHLPGLAGGTAARIAALRQAQAASAGDAAIALVPVDLAAGSWQLSLDVAPGSTVAQAAVLAERIAQALGGTLVSMACALAKRDDGRPLATLDEAELFATRERGLCWAAWPREAHGADGITWSWPTTDRHGVPERAARIPGASVRVWCVGKGSAVSADAATALRVTGTCLAMGAAVGQRAALSAQPDRAH